MLSNISVKNRDALHKYVQSFVGFSNVGLKYTVCTYFNFTINCLRVIFKYLITRVHDILRRPKEDKDDREK